MNLISKNIKITATFTQCSSLLDMKAVENRCYCHKLLRQRVLFMNNKSVLIAFILSVTVGFTANANDIDDITMDVEVKEFKRGHKMKMGIGSVVREYMLENGDITQEEIDAKKAEREAVRAELKALKEAGDTEALAAKKEELKAQREEHRAAMKEYVESNEELKAAIDEKKAELKERRSERRERRKERKAEASEG